MCLLQARNMDYCYNELFRSESCKSDVSLSWLTKRSSSLLLNAEPTCRLGVIRGSIWSPFTYKKWKMNKLYSFERLWSMKEDAGVTCRVGEISRLHIPLHVNNITVCSQVTLIQCKVEHNTIKSFKSLSFFSLDNGKKITIQSNPFNTDTKGTEPK